jgi:Cys-tRNA(Pro)/Cys-tRNA(Cys) deacylase
MSLLISTATMLRLRPAKAALARHAASEHHTAIVPNADKTQAMHVLDAKRIAYTAKVYDATRDFHSAGEAAALLGAAPDSVYKTLVVLREAPGRPRPLLVMAPSHRQLDLRLLARSLGEKKLRMAGQREAESLTGLKVGGISALALLNKPFDVVIDEPARTLDRIHVSAGQRGIDLELRVEDLLAVTGARFAVATTED